VYYDGRSVPLELEREQRGKTETLPIRLRIDALQLVMRADA